MGDPERSVKQQRATRRATQQQRADAVRRRRKRRLWLWWSGGGVIILAVLVVLVVGNRAQASPTIDGVQCNTNEGAVLHIHQHLTIYAAGSPVAIPAGIGINQTRGCLFWLHTHTPDGVIHVESPTQASYTLGQFFSIWGQPLNTTQAASAVATGSQQLRAYVNGRLYRGNPRAIPLTAHALITLEVGPPWVTPRSWTFQAGE